MIAYLKLIDSLIGTHVKHLRYTVNGWIQVRSINPRLFKDSYQDDLVFLLVDRIPYLVEMSRQLREFRIQLDLLTWDLQKKRPLRDTLEFRKNHISKLSSPEVERFLTNIEAELISKFTPLLQSDSTYNDTTLSVFVYSQSNSYWIERILQALSLKSGEKRQHEFKEIIDYLKDESILSGVNENEEPSNAH